MFHPDNIKNFHSVDKKVSVSLYQFWKTYGGIRGLAQRLNTHPKNGIEGSQADIAQRQAKYGSNQKRLPKIRTLLELILENFEDRIL
jgi:magnesium-transporting ATPase (P-type)